MGKTIIKGTNRRTKLNHNEYCERLEEYFDGNINPLEQYVNQRTSILHHCNKHNINFMGTPATLMNGSTQCEECKKEINHIKLMDSIESLKEKLFDKYGDKYKLMSAEYKGFKDTLEFMHYPENDKPHIVKSRFSRIMSDTKCPVCCGIQISTGYNDVATTNPELVHLFANKNDAYIYSKSSNKRTDFKCPTCGNIIKDKSINQVLSLKSLSCPVCSDGVSFPNKFIYNILKQVTNLDFLKREYRPKWCTFIFNGKDYHGIYDIYFGINNNKYIVEMDGGLGHGNKSTIYLTPEESKYIDKQKDIKAVDNGIKVIRIDCNYNGILERYNYIKDNIISSFLNSIIDFSKIDFIKANKESEKSYVVECAKLWNLGFTSGQIKEKLDLNRSIVSTYLNRATIAGLCNYDGVSSIRRSFSRPIVCVNTGEIFDTVTDAANFYNINTKSLTDCCNGKEYSAGKHKVTHEKLFWIDLSEYKNMSDKDIELYLQNKLDDRYKYSNEKPVICLDDNIVYHSITEAVNKTNGSYAGISKCCKMEMKTSGGKHWMYYKDYIREFGEVV